MPRRHVVSLLTGLAALALPSAASAQSTISHPDNSRIVVTLQAAGATLNYFASAEFNFPNFDDDYDISSPQGFDTTPPGCTEDNGSSPPDNLDCSPTPPQTQVTGSGNADTINGSCSVLFAVPSALIANTGGGNDAVTVGFFCGSTVDMGDGDDSFSGAGTVTLGNGDDSFTGSGTANGGAGNDTFSAGGGNDTLTGEAGNDSLFGGAGNDTIDAGDGRDTIDGGDGDDTLTGGPGRDFIAPGLGKDVINGGDGPDTVSYEDRADGAALTLSLNGAADDGAEGEQDTIAADVENVIGSPGVDSITGDAGPNDLDGGANGDSVDPGAGPDVVNGGDGNDVIRARDGVQDRVDCGAGDDTAVTDEFDTAVGCETLQSSRELMADVDNDGIAAPVDCDDRNAARRPGLPDRPGNNVDEDCSGADAAFPRVTTGVSFTFRVVRARLRFTRLTLVDIAPDTTVEVRCSGGRRRGCFSGIKRRAFPRGAEKASILSLVRRQRLRSRAVLEVRVLRPDTIGKVARFTARGRRAPSSRTLCLTPGATPPARC